LAQEQAPVDERLRAAGIFVPLPLNPFVPSDFPRRTDRHHAFFPADAPELQYVDYTTLPDDLNSRAVRWGRIQEGNRLFHAKYHEWYDSVPLPTTDEDRFKTLLFCAAGYIPELAANPIGKQSHIVSVDDRMLRYLHSRNRIRIEDGRRWQVGLFLCNYIIRNGVAAIRETAQAAQFMEATAPRQRNLLSYALIHLAAKNLMDDIEPQYERARTAGQINPRQHPPRALRFLMNHFDNHPPRYQEAIEDALSTTLEAA